MMVFIKNQNDVFSLNMMNQKSILKRIVSVSEVIMVFH